jgi:hypothetical protein
MKTQKISESGLIGTDGRLRMPMDRLNEWFAQHKGERVVIRFEAAAPGSSELQLAYYFNYIVPTIQTELLDTGVRKTEKQVDLWLRSQCWACYDCVGGGLLEAREMSKPDFSDFLEWLKQFAAENLYVYIEDPRTI